MHNVEKIRFVSPAAPGFYVLEPCYNEAGDAICEVYREPVVAWALDAIGCVTPVTAHEALNSNDFHAILCPDGAVRAYNDAWKSEADWLDQQKAKVPRDQLR